MAFTFSVEKQEEGLLDKSVVEITGYSFEPFTYPGRGVTVMAAHLKMKPLDPPAEEAEQIYPLSGAPDEWVVSEDRQTVEDAPRDGLVKTSNLAQFLRECVNCGIPKKETDAPDLKWLVGYKLYVERKPTTTGFRSASEDGATVRQPTILLPTRLVGKPGQAYKKGGKPATAPATGTEAAEGVAEPQAISEDITNLVYAVIKINGGTIARTKLPGQIMGRKLEELQKANPEVKVADNATKQTAMRSLRAMVEAGLLVETEGNLSTP